MTVNEKSKANLKPFVKGYDPRRAIARVPKNTPKARELFRRIGAELLTIRERQANGEDVEYDITRLEAMIRLKFSSKQSKDFETILKALFPGLLKEEVDVTSGGKPLTWKEFLADADTGADSEKPEAIRGSISKDTDEG